MRLIAILFIYFSNYVVEVKELNYFKDSFHTLFINVAININSTQHTLWNLSILNMLWNLYSILEKLSSCNKNVTNRHDQRQYQKSC